MHPFLIIFASTDDDDDDEDEETIFCPGPVLPW
jgi:hypothetical protein